MALKQKIAAYGFMTLMMAAVFVAMAPTAQAQGGAIAVDIEVTRGQGQNDFLMPESGQEIIRYKVTLQMPAASGCTSNIQLNLRGSGPAYAAIVMNPSTRSFIYEADGAPFVAPAGGSRTFENLEMVVTSTRDAPAYRSDQYTISVEARPGPTSTCNFDPGTGTQPVTIKNDYFPIVQAIAPRTLLKAGQNSEVQFAVEVQNFGNGQTRITSDHSYLSRDQLASLIPPPAFILESKAQQGPQATDLRNVNVQARTPHSNGYTNTIYSFQINFEGEYAGSRPAGEPARDRQSVFLSLQVQGVYAPGLDPLLLVGAIGLGLVAFRRRFPGTE